MIIKTTKILPFSDAISLETVIAQRFPTLQKVRYISAVMPNTSGEKIIKLTGDESQAMEKNVTIFFETIAVSATTTKEPIIEEKAMPEVKSPVPAVEPVANNVITEGTQKLQEAMQAIFGAASDAASHSQGMIGRFNQFKQEMQAQLDKFKLEEAKSRDADAGKIKNEFIGSIDSVQKASEQSLVEIGKIETKIGAIEKVVDTRFAELKNDIVKFGTIVQNLEVMFADISRLFGKKLK